MSRPGRTRREVLPIPQNETSVHVRQSVTCSSGSHSIPNWVGTGYDFDTILAFELPMPALINFLNHLADVQALIDGIVRESEALEYKSRCRRLVCRMRFSADVA